ncbi:zinc finger and BTB domain-containing protein 17-like isoform X5 [Mya arenaria]|uniref:zinc finger and BTB domain-containing protein 17-like isoform X5 n=1 Tax=Mya arenaria TaxID=6604 RepID=UPI0022E052C7|nr:zinc finger and BTB domain-containing protein 17-like isoform X5 [Mya arenaria]
MASDDKGPGLKAFMMPVRISQAGAQSSSQAKIAVSPGGTQHIMTTQGLNVPGGGQSNTIIIIPASDQSQGGEHVVQLMAPDSVGEHVQVATTPTATAEVQTLYTTQHSPVKRVVAMTPESRAAALDKIRQANRERLQQGDAKPPSTGRGSTPTHYVKAAKPGGGTQRVIYRIGEGEAASAPSIDPSLLITEDSRKQSKDQRTLTLPPIGMAQCETQNICIEIEVDNELNVGELESCRLKNGKTKFFFKISKQQIHLKATEHFTRQKQKITVTPVPKRKLPSEDFDMYDDLDDYDDDEEIEEKEAKKPAAKKMKLPIKVIKAEKGVFEESGGADNDGGDSVKDKKVVIEPLPYEIKDDGTYEAEEDEAFDDEAGDDDDDFEEEVAEAESKTSKPVTRKGKKMADSTQQTGIVTKRAAPKKTPAKRKGRKALVDEDGNPEVRSLTKAVPKSLAEEDEGEDGTPKRTYFRTNAYAKNDKFLVLREGGKNIYECKECHYKSRHNSNMNDHLRTHTGEKPFVCGVCHKSFRAQSNLNQHLTIHYETRAHECSVCGVKVKTKQQLNTHKKIHTHEKNIKCDECDKMFSSQRLLKQHKVSHSDVRPYQCSYCSMSFKISAMLQRHMFIHTGKGKFQCEICKKSFARKESLTNHVGGRKCEQTVLLIEREIIAHEKIDHETYIDENTKVDIQILQNDGSVPLEQMDTWSTVVEEGGDYYLVEKTGEMLRISRDDVEQSHEGARLIVPQNL